MLGDLSKVNYSSWGGGQLGFRNTIEDCRRLTLIPMFCMPVRRRMTDTLVLLGKIPARAVDEPATNLCATQWTAPRFESVDPVPFYSGANKMHEPSPPERRIRTWLGPGLPLYNRGDCAIGGSIPGANEASTLGMAERAPHREMGGVVDLNGKPHQ